MRSLVLLIPLAGVLTPTAEAVCTHADRIVVLKSQRSLTLECQGNTIQTYRVALGGDPVGPKEQQGDHKTPEGHYVVDAKNQHSAYHLALHISYPNSADKLRAAHAHVAPGGDIMIHGLPPRFAWMGALHRQTDWTDGCIAVTDAEIDEIFKAVPVGTPVDIRP